jgi:hypothetical protein
MGRRAATEVGMHCRYGPHLGYGFCSQWGSFLACCGIMCMIRGPMSITTLGGEGMAV